MIRSFARVRALTLPRALLYYSFSCSSLCSSYLLFLVLFSFTLPCAPPSDLPNHSSSCSSLYCSLCSSYAPPYVRAYVRACACAYAYARESCTMPLVAERMTKRLVLTKALSRRLQLPTIEISEVQTDFILAKFGGCRIPSSLKPPTLSEYSSNSANPTGLAPWIEKFASIILRRSDAAGKHSRHRLSNISYNLARRVRASALCSQ